MSALYNHASMQIKSSSQHRGGEGATNSPDATHPQLSVTRGGRGLGGSFFLGGGGWLKGVGLGLGNMLAVDTFCKGNRPLEHLPEKNAEKCRIPNSRGHTKAWESVPPTKGATPKRGCPYPQLKGPRNKAWIASP